jgi:hypothetical protein
MGVELFYADRRTDMKVIIVLFNFPNAPKNVLTCSILFN